MGLKQSLGFTFAIIFTCFQVSKGSSYHDHGGPQNWPNLYRHCGGKRQSPIALPNVLDAPHNSIFPAIIRSDTFWKVPKSITVRRSDESVFVEPYFENHLNVNITGGSLNGTYILSQIHFHWGDQDEYGSEHSINGTFASIELHAVHYNSKYRSFKNAQAKLDGLAVVAYLFRVVSKTASPGMDTLTNWFKYMLFEKKDHIKIEDGFSMDKLTPPFTNNYLVYPGSLTTPPCTESVTWIVYGIPLEISRSNIARFRAFYGIEPGMRNNFRPLQPLNARVIRSQSGADA